MITHMGIEHLDLTEERMVKDHTGGGLAYEPVTLNDVNRGAVR